jgi:DNA-binding NtrC family response regulator
MSTVKREQIERVLEQCRGNRTAAARMLGISRRSFYRWLDRLDVTAVDQRLPSTSFLRSA